HPDGLTALAGKNICDCGLRIADRGLVTHLVFPCAVFMDDTKIEINWFVSSNNSFTSSARSYVRRSPYPANIERV
ncbi:MAG TPA: hypothetical protein VK468_09830, partial [Pyrinomonadaceae bacterium]|nr:hypothetical protein [Pyrinomonadaceae bacterium]